MTWSRYIIAGMLLLVGCGEDKYVDPIIKQNRYDDTLHMRGGYFIEDIIQPNGQHLWIRGHKSRVETRGGWWCWTAKNYDLVVVGWEGDKVLIKLIQPKNPDGRDYWEAYPWFAPNAAANVPPECDCGIKFRWPVGGWLNAIKRQDADPNSLLSPDAWR